MSQARIPAALRTNFNEPDREAARRKLWKAGRYLA